MTCRCRIDDDDLLSALVNDVGKGMEYGNFLGTRRAQVFFDVGLGQPDLRPLALAWVKTASRYCCRASPSSMRLTVSPSVLSTISAA